MSKSTLIFLGFIATCAGSVIVNLLNVATPWPIASVFDFLNGIDLVVVFIGVTLVLLSVSSKALLKRIQ